MKTCFRNFMMMKNYYLFGSRIATHVGFWLVYYVCFGLIWAKEGDYWASFFLEFVLLPIRIMAVYISIYFLIPYYLKEKKVWQFSSWYVVLIIVSSILQRLFSFYFYEGAVSQNLPLFDIFTILRAFVLINSTVLFVSALKIIQLWYVEMEKNQSLQKKLAGERDVLAEKNIVEIKSDKRVHRIPADDLLYVEGLGNYVVYHTRSKKLISYTSLKQALETLPSNFERIHKSYLINKDHVNSYDLENVEIMGDLLPVGRSYKGSISLGEHHR